MAVDAAGGNSPADGSMAVAAGAALVPASELHAPALAPAAPPVIAASAIDVALDLPPTAPFAVPRPSRETGGPVAGARTATWAVDIKRSACAQSCCSKACRRRLEVGQVRVKSARDHGGRRWFHPGCIAGGLGPLEAIEGVGNLKVEERQHLQEVCDDPGAGRVRATFVAGVRATKRHRSGEAAGRDPPPEDDLEEDGANGSTEGTGSPEQVMNLGWFDDLSYGALATWVPTASVVPREAIHAVARLKGAILKAGAEAKAQGDGPGHARAWKALTFLDRLLFAQLPRRKQGKKGDARAAVVRGKVKRAWRGDWGALFAEASMAGRAGRGKPQGDQQARLHADVRAIEACVGDGLLSKAVARARGAMEMVAGSDTAGALRALFPRGAPAPMQGGPGGLGPELREELVEAAATAIQRHPKRSSPGPNGSRFEHWGVLAADVAALRAGAELLVDFLLGECPPEALNANLGARLMALRKPAGGIRPVAMGSVVRRLAARAACAALKGQIAGAVGPHQYGVGRPAGCELVHKSITALVDDDRSRAVIAFDAVNASGSLPWGRVWAGITARMPELASTARAWLGQPTSHVFWEDGGASHQVEATAGVHQGCPLSP